jgi:hypothetical protein
MKLKTQSVGGTSRGQKSLQIVGAAIGFVGVIFAYLFFWTNARYGAFLLVLVVFLLIGNTVRVMGSGTRGYVRSVFAKSLNRRRNLRYLLASSALFLATTLAFVLTKTDRLRFIFPLVVFGLGVVIFFVQYRSSDIPNE